MSQSPFGFALVSDLFIACPKRPVRVRVTIAFRLCFGFWFIRYLDDCPADKLLSQSPFGFALVSDMQYRGWKALGVGLKSQSPFGFALVSDNCFDWLGYVGEWQGHNRLSALLWFLMLTPGYHSGYGKLWGHNRLSALLWFLMSWWWRWFFGWSQGCHNRLSALLWFLIWNVRTTQPRRLAIVTIAFRLCFGFWYAG